MVSQLIAPAVMFHFGQVFIFCRLEVNQQNVSEWFLLMMCQEHTLMRYANFFGGNHPTLWFWLRREGQQIQYWTVTLSSWKKQLLEVFYKKAILKNSANFRGKYLCWILFLIKLQAWAFNLLKRDLDTGAFLWNLRNF